MRQWMLLFCTALFSLLFISYEAGVGDAQVPPTPVPTSNASYSGRQFIRANRLGITFISSAQLDSDPVRYQNALLLGAGWTRWPLYWNFVEPSQGQFNWAEYDRLVIEDTRYDLKIDAILLNRPEFYADGNRIVGINEPIFADGSDVIGDGKSINPNNPWANFVYQAVQRYKPGGVLAREQGWVNGEGVDVWEVWNEPDLPQFWSGGIPAYARLLKVAYLAAHLADPNATVMFGGLLYNTADNWLARVLAIYDSDAFARSNNWFMDAVALHSYSYPWRTGWLTLYVRETLDAYGISRPIFVNETGISVWDDYPGPVWASSAEQRLKLGTAEQQAWFFIQSTAYAYVEGATVVFFHQLYDDCGDQGPGTNFPPNNGELCTTGACFGDAWGLFRNPSDAICYSQNPNAGTARPSAAAFRMMSQVFGEEDFIAGDTTRNEGVTIISFERPATQERILVVWNTRFEANTAVIPSSGASATMVTLRGTSNIFPNNNEYRIPLNPAEPDNYLDLENGDISAIGGEPIILIEAFEGEMPSLDATSVVQVEEASGTAIAPTPGPVIVPTTAVENDSQPPVPFVNPLPEVSQSSFSVSWGASDNGQVERYIVWVQVNDGEWTPWLETERTESIYTGEVSNTYRFAVWAVDTAGNWSSNVSLEAQAQTRVE
jgi:hypothetical protein